MFWCSGWFVLLICVGIWFVWFFMVFLYEGKCCSNMFDVILLLVVSYRCVLSCLEFCM